MKTLPDVSASHALRLEARLTGVFYLALGISGMLGFLWIRPALFRADDAAATLATVLARDGLARAGVVVEMATVVTQALVALWFFRLFRAVDAFAAAAIAAFGFMNAVAVLVSAMCLATSLQAAREGMAAAHGHVQLLYLLSENCWRVGNLFFGLWLVPMGWCILRSGWMPRALGWVLVVGGVGYVVSALGSVVAPSAGLVIGLLVIPATIGEFWMIGYLLTKGVRVRQP